MRDLRTHLDYATLRDLDQLAEQVEAKLKAADSRTADRLRSTRDLFKSVRDFAARICSFDCDQLTDIKARLDKLEADHLKMGVDSKEPSC